MAAVAQEGVGFGHLCSGGIAALMSPYMSLT